MLKNTLLGVVSPTRITALAALVALGLVSCGNDNPGEPSVYPYEIYEDDLVVGDKSAPITIIEYSSFTCPHCAAFHEEVFPYLEEKYLKTGKASIVLRPFFWDSAAAKAALLSNCVPDALKLKMTETLFAGQQVWIGDAEGPQEGLVKIARQAQISREGFQACLDDTKNKEWGQRHYIEASQDYSITSTPTFMINGEKVGLITTVDDLDRIMAKFVMKNEGVAPTGSEAEGSAEE